MTAKKARLLSMKELEDKNRAHEETAFIFEWKEDFRRNLSTNAVL